MICRVKNLNGSVNKYECSEGELLYEVLSLHGSELSAPCGGKGKCGKCRVKVVYGLKADEDGTCLACRTTIHEDCEVELIKTKNEVLVSGSKTAYVTDGKDGLGIAVDIGTTTIAAYLMRLKDGNVLASASSLNPQRIHGADVITRLQFALDSKQNRALLKSEISDMLSDMTKTLLEKANIKTNIDSYALVGNTVMMHLAGGYNPDGLAKAPFIPYYTAGHHKIADKHRVYFGGCVSGYVGADTVAAMLACEMDMGDETALLIDIGTNGEIVLRHNGRFFCCSCAAGPAFEGAHIVCGTGAVEGAVDHVNTDGSFTTIGGKNAVGICGSGLIDAVAYLCEEEEISPTGRMKQRYNITDNVFIDPADIREVQLAKAAIAAGIEILTDRAGIKTDGIDVVYLAGGFGNFINIASACRIGMLPEQIQNRIKCVGNAAGDGAKMMLLSSESRLRAENLRRKTEYIELSDQPDFEDIYTDKLVFEEE